MPTASDVLAQEYRLIEKIGEGGMGTVWLARDEVLHRDVAVKVLHEALLRDPKANARFRNEARAAARLRHPNICGVIDVGEHGGAPFLVMPRLKGESLAARIAREGRIAPGDAVEITLAVLRALHAAHTANILHRDLKPANVFLTAEEGGVVVKILDFGASKFLAHDVEPLTRTGAVVGTPTYMSPEQAQGSARVDARADIWGAGVVLYEMLSGRPPYEASNCHAMLIKVATQEPRPVLQSCPGLDKDLARVVMTALAFRPEDRYANGRAFAAELRDWQSRAGAPSPAPSASMVPAAPAWSTPSTPLPIPSFARPAASVARVEPAPTPEPASRTVDGGTPPPSTGAYRRSLPPAAAVRAGIAHALLQELRATRGGEAALTAARGTALDEIDAAGRHDWLPLATLIRVCERAHDALGERPFRAVVRKLSARLIDEAFRRELAPNALPHLSATPVSLLMRVPHVWPRIFTAAGAVRFEPRATMAEGALVWTGMPVECHGRSSVVVAVSAALEGIYDVIHVSGAVGVAERDPARGMVRFVAEWNRL